MKKTLLTLSLLFAMASGNAQNLLSEGFETFPPTGWGELNNSVPVGTDNWYAGDVKNFMAQGGSVGSFLGNGFLAVDGANTISDWLFAPAVSLQNGDVISFYTRTMSSPTDFPDRLEMRIAVGAAPAVPVGNDGVGDFTNLAVSINPDLTGTGYPAVWTKYSYTVTGMPTAATCRIAFRYFVTNSGPDGANGNYIGLDTFSVDRPQASTDAFFASNFSIQPNPVNDVFSLTAKNGVSIDNVKVLDINGRIVNQMNVSSTEAIQVNVSELNAGVYFVKVQSELGVGTTKIIKK